MLMRTDPFRDFDRFTQHLLGTNARPSAMLMDAWREGDQFVVEFDLPGVDPGSVDLDVERNVLTVTATRPAVDEQSEFLAAERPRGVFSRQLVLGDNLDLDRIQASYGGGVLELEPNEADNLPLPPTNAGSVDTQKLDCLARSGQIEQILELTDAAYLRKGMGLSAADVDGLRSIWAKLSTRRTSRKFKRRDRVTAEGMSVNGVD